MKILLTGDSWAAGDWNLVEHYEYVKNDPPKNISPILSNLLTDDGHDVIHEYHPGQSDISAIESVNTHVDNVDCVIFFKTQAIRTPSLIYNNKKLYESHCGSSWPTYEEFLENGFLGLEQHIVDEIKSHGFASIKELFTEFKCIKKIFDSINHELIYKSLYKINNKLLLVGGIEKIKTKYKFKNVIEDLVEFLTGYQNNYYTAKPRDFMNFYKIIMTANISLDLKNTMLSQLIEIVDHNQQFTDNFLQHKKYFGPNDNVHPNKIAIDLYYQVLIKPKLKEIEDDYRTALKGK